jgi:Flp pilus assembly protein TadD/peroxiredoxin
MPRHTRKPHLLSRRALLKGLACAPVLLRPSPLHGVSLILGVTGIHPEPESPLHFADIRLAPVYPRKSPLEDVLRLVPAGSDEYLTERYAFEIQALLEEWSRSLRVEVRDASGPAKLAAASIQFTRLHPAKEVTIRADGGLEILRRLPPGDVHGGATQFIRQFQDWLTPLSSIETAEFEIIGIDQTGSGPLTIQLDIRYDIAGRRTDGKREERVGRWRTEWTRSGSAAWTATRWEAGEETVSRAAAPAFLDVTAHALGATASYRSQMLRGSDYWRTVLDGACGIDVYGNNGVAVGDFDNDGFDDLYVCQPAGLPNRLYRNRGDGTFDDVTEKAGVGVLDNTACTLFADFRNNGLQDLLVVSSSGPLLFLNRGDGTFAIKRNAFRFAKAPEGSFTHAAIADYDRDGRLDIYFCLYSYYLGLDQYHYPVPYFDARNGPANFLLHNEGDGTFIDRTEAAGLNAENDRYSFACAWGEAGSRGYPDLYVANDFGRGNLYRNNGDGTFTPVSHEAQADDAGAGMSAAWADYDLDGKPDIYAANMWSAAGQRVAAQKLFHQNTPGNIRALYRQHARGNFLYRNQGNDQFENVSERAGVAMGRWSWCSDFLDFDHDGYPDLYVANGYISAPHHSDLASFFWRQVVGRSPDDATPAPGYERGWQALNELIRSDSSWNGYERNVMFANNRDGTFSEVSGALGLDFSQDSRSFALADIDHDGRLEVILKNRNAPQLRILRNAMPEIGQSIAFRLRGTKSNRDAIGAAITVESGSLRQTKYVQAGSGFLAQHSKELLFGLGKGAAPVHATIQWSSGLSQELANLPAGHRIEVEEGSAFTATPFVSSPAAYTQSAPAPASTPDQLLTKAATWLIQPLPAPEFSLPDLNGAEQNLSDFRDNFVLLFFWASTAPLSTALLQTFQRHNTALLAGQIKILAINVDNPANANAARSFGLRERISFPVLFATEHVAGTYNIIYRYLFDRRRDLGIPTAFLLDKQGMIVRLYQGTVEPSQIRSDVNSIPVTAADRMRKALPFAGTLYQGAFARNDFTYGVAMFQHGYLDEAAASFAQVIVARPDYPEAYYNLGTLNLQRHNFAEARRNLEQALKLHPNYPEAWNNLGMMAAQQGNADEAIRNFRQSLSLRPDYTTALLNLGNLYRRQGNLEAAQKSLTRALQIQPDDPETNYSLGMFYAQQNQLDQAQTFLEKALALRPGYSEAANNLGVLFVRQQNFARAEQQFANCIQANPTFDQAYLNLARLYLMQNDKTRARDILQQLLRVAPQNAAGRQALDAVSSMP